MSGILPRNLERPLPEGLGGGFGSILGLQRPLLGRDSHGSDGSARVHTSITRHAAGFGNRLIRRDRWGHSRGFDSHHPLHFPARKKSNGSIEVDMLADLVAWRSVSEDDLGRTPGTPAGRQDRRRLGLRPVEAHCNEHRAVRSRQPVGLLSLARRVPLNVDRQ